MLSQLYYARAEIHPSEENLTGMKGNVGHLPEGAGGC